LLAALLMSTLLGCVTSPASRGAEFYRQGRHIDADLVFEHGEPQLAQLDASERARYALYRGSNYLALGDRDAAGRWLMYGARLARVGAFSAEERAMLHTGLRAAGYRVSVDGIRVDGGASVLGAAGVGETRKVGPGLVVQGARLSP
jgi:hypothetical protein